MQGLSELPIVRSYPALSGESTYYLPVLQELELRYVLDINLVDFDGHEQVTKLTHNVNT